MVQAPPSKRLTRMHFLKTSGIATLALALDALGFFGGRAEADTAIDQKVGYRNSGELYEPGGESRYPESISVLESIHGYEFHVQKCYMGYAQKAQSEGYPGIAYLFAGLAVSEGIHAENCKDLLSRFGMEIEGTAGEEIEIGSTKKNLAVACKMELDAIDHIYPRSLQQVQPENHESTIGNLTSAWESEKQHRDMIKKIQSGTGILFGLLVREIEGTPLDIYVCRSCGSTVTDLPEDCCTICEDPASNHQKVQSIDADDASE